MKHIGKILFLILAVSLMIVGLSLTASAADTTIILGETLDDNGVAYTWESAWAKAIANPKSKYILKLNDDYTTSSTETVQVSAQYVSVEVDLCGHTLNLQTPIYFNQRNGSYPFSLYTSTAGGIVNAETSVIQLGGQWTFNFDFGQSGKNTAPTINANSHLVTASQSFKAAATVNLDLYGGTYYCSSLMNVYNNKSYIESDSVTYADKRNKYNITVTDADIVTSGNVIFVSMSGKTLPASDASKLVMEIPLSVLRPVR